MLYFRYFKKIFTVIILGIFLFGCEEPQKKKVQNTTDLPSQEPKKIIYDDLFVKEESNYILIPVGISPDNNEQRDGFFSRRSNQNKNFYNIIFYHKKKYTASLLLQKKSIIKSFNFLEIDISPKTEDTERKIKSFWLYRIITSDTNRDGKLNDLDAHIGYISDVSGKNLRQITPPNSQLINWSVLSAEGEIIVKILSDSDKDLKFTEKDNVSFIKVDLNNPKIGNNLISNELEQQIKSYSLEE